jgi:hypothetical protein
MIQKEKCLSTEAQTSWLHEISALLKRSGRNPKNEQTIIPADQRGKVAFLGSYFLLQEILLEHLMHGRPCSGHVGSIREQNRARSLPWQSPDSTGNGK